MDAPVHVCTCMAGRHRHMAPWEQPSGRHRGDARQHQV